MTIEKRVAEYSAKLENFVLEQSLTDVDALSVLFLHWAARCGLASKSCTSIEEFTEAAKAAFKMAVDDFSPTKGSAS